MSRSTSPSARRSRALLVALGALSLGLPLAAPSRAADAAPLPSSYVAPAPPGGQLQDLGSPMSSLTVVEGAFGRLPDGTFVAYAAPMGENAELNVSTTWPQPATQLGRYRMPGASGDATIAVAPDGTVYIGTYYDGHLFSWDPATKQMTDLGRPTPSSTYLYGLSVAPDGTVFGGSYSDAHAWSYTPGAGFTDLGGVPDPAVQYVRATAYDPERNALFIGTSPAGHVYRLDLATKALTEIALAPGTKAPSVVSDMDYTGGQVFLNLDGNLRVIDAATSTEIPLIDGDTGKVTRTYALSARGVSEARQGGVYTSIAYGGAVHLVRYDLATHTIKRTGATARRGALIGFGWNVENGKDVLYAFSGNYSGGGFRYEVGATSGTSLQFQITAPPSPLQHVLPTADGSKVYVNAFLNGNTSTYDVASGVATATTRLGQVEDWTLGASGTTVFAGTYPDGSLVSVPATGGTPPLTTYATLKPTYQQIRPIEAKEHAGRIYYGTAPDYGQRGGAIAVLDPATKAVDVTRNVVPDHTIASIAFVGDAMFVGSSTVGGTGTDPLPGEARLAQWDPTTKQVLRSVTPVPGARSINALVEHNGRLYGLADGTLFEVDPATLTVTRSMDVGVPGPKEASDGELVFHPNGYLYVQTGEAIVVVDPLAFARATRVGDDVHRLEPSVDRTLWTTIRPEGFVSYLDLGRFTPAATECATPDTRDTVTLFGKDTAVRNRFLTTGCTLQDRFPLTATQGSYAGTVNPWLDGLVAAGTISSAERDLLWNAAKAGR